MLLELDQKENVLDAKAGLKTAAPGLPASDLMILQGPEAIAQIETAWHDLADIGGVGTPFQSFAAAAAAASAHLERFETPRIVVVRKTGRAVIIFPTVVTSYFGCPTVRFLGDPLIQYGDVLASPQATRDDFAAAWVAATDPRIACLALFRRVRDDARAAGFLAQMARVTAVQESPIIDVGEASQLRARDARELRRLRRRLAEQGVLDIRFVNGPEAADLLSEALQLKRRWMKQQGLLSAVIGNAHWEQALFNMCLANPEAGGLVVAVLTVDSRLAALEAGFVDNTCWYAFLGAFAPDYASMGPGRILTAECIEYTRKIGRRIYDQLPPSQTYKRRHATASVTVRDYALALTLRGCVPLAMSQAIPQFKLLLNATPIEIRRPALSLCESIKSRR